jgi:choline kinase
MNRFIQKIKRDSITTTVGILSAGVGNRIKSNEPRSLLKVGNRTLLEHQISVVRNVFSEPEIIVGLGVEANKVIKKLGFSARYVENQLYELTGSAETMRLILNNSDADSILFFHGDLYFGQELLQNLDYGKSFVLASNQAMQDREVGVTKVKNKATIFSHGLDLKWCQIIYLCGKELKLLRSAFIKHSEDIKNMLTFEVLNLIINKGGNIRVIEPDKISILEIDCMKDLKNENFNI